MQDVVERRMIARAYWLLIGKTLVASMAFASHFADAQPNAARPGGLVPKQWEELAEPVWQQLQAQLTTLSTNSMQLIVGQAGHNIQFEKPQVVIDAILDVVQRVRASRAISRANVSGEAICCVPAAPVRARVR